MFFFGGNMKIRQELGKMRLYKHNFLDKVTVVLFQSFGESSCFNCYNDDSGSSGVYNPDTGTEEFENGKICPVCNGKGFIKNIKMEEVDCNIRSVDNKVYVKGGLGLCDDTEKVFYIKYDDMDWVDLDKDFSISDGDGEYTIVDIKKDDYKCVYSIEAKGVKHD